ncbi:S8 family serine peptidase [Streptomyces bambusae]|uniref:S8 family serine peptidase n=1 Tax=Streptomyces bambusae TaxID=1550616 RepID=UPI001CFEBD1D|nr:S8 family serine peptidase [Streptomyces bambusae]MCB5164489.1 S8 family serine peptidase [Streptomyces bambusae]
MTLPRRSTALTTTTLALALALGTGGLQANATGDGPPARADAGDPTARYIVVLPDDADPTALSDRQTRRLRTTRTAIFRHALKGYAAELTVSQAAELRRDPAVRFVAAERSYQRTESGAPAVPATGTPRTAGRCTTATDLTRRQCLPMWADRIDAEKSSVRSGDGRGPAPDVNVAIVDSGVAGDHPDLDVRGGADCLTGTAELPGTALSDPLQVGTAKAAIIGARDNDRGIVGVAPGTPLWPVKVFADDGRPASDSQLLCALDWLASTRADTTPANDIAVAHLGFTRTHFFQQPDDGRCGTLNQDALHLAVCNTVRAGVTLVASAANFNVGFAMTTPAAYDEVVTTTAMTDFDGKPGGKTSPTCQGEDLATFGYLDDQAAIPFSNFARSAADRRHTVAAPGICLETAPDPADPAPALYAGAGLAAAIATGVAALCVEAGRCGRATPAKNVRTLVDDAAAHGRHHPGYGFYGDPRHPIRGRFYGPLLSARLY